MNFGWYCLITLSNAVVKLSFPPKTAVDSEKLEDATSIGSRKWLMI